MKRWLWAMAVVGLALAGCTDDVTSNGRGSIDVDAAQDGSGFPTKDAALDADDASPDAAKTDTSTTPDPELPDWFGQPCDENADCDGGWCVQGQNGYVCTKTCIESCPEGYLCKGVTTLGPDVVFVCLPDVQRLCEACVDDQQCPLGGTCRDFPDGRYCVSECGGGVECPVGYACQDIGPEAGGEGARMRCLPESGSCSCGVADAGKVRSCQVKNAYGTCLGLQTCGGAEGWTACSAQTPAAEVCDGLDNDCDGIIDNGLPTGLACENTVPGLGTCTGTQVCAGDDGWVCNAPQPTPETCDYQDNDCDGQTDEGFTDAFGQYTTDAHCGACNVSCAGAVANGTATCSSAKSPPQCVVAACDPGYLKLNDYQCVAGVSTVCQACSSDANCLFEGSKCLQLADGKFCTQPCGSVADCPSGYECQNVAGAASKQCVPSTGSCSCDGTNLTLQRGCSKTFQGSASTPAYTCAGVEKCTPSGWASCELPLDVCDGLDNDCDGIIDNAYLNPVTGKYTTNSHCGVCGNDCGNLVFANAVGVCDTAPAVPNCVMQCKPGFFDVNDNPNDGCECQFISALDLPGGADTNCDGVDGEVDNAVFVSKAGDDSAPGTVDMPMRTIQAAIGRAASTGKRDVYVATGVYVESIALQEGVGLYGGYSAEFDQRDPAVYETAIIGLPPTDALRGAVNAVSVGNGPTKQTVLDGFTIFGANNPEPGGSSYAIYLRNVGPKLVIADNYVVAGDGGHGANGDVGANGANGVPGLPGVAAQNTGGTTCSSSHHAAGGSGGQQMCGGVDTSGGAGGMRVCPNVAEIADASFTAADQTPTAAEFGKAGSNNAPGFGTGGEAGWHNRVRNSCGTCSSPNKHTTDGAHGTAGRPGQDGAVATACTNAQGYVLNGHWNPYGGGDGKAGTAGGGGGGGGAGGGVDLPSMCTSNSKAVGGSGGGGGSGACGAAGGKGGTGGGGSFGIFMTFATPPASLPLVYGNVIVRGRGGDGGDGGAGGLGGFGGAGGEGGSNSQGPGTPWVSICGNFGGWGGNGGNGGHGSGGAGGCGGVSYGFFIANAGANPNVSSLMDNTYPPSGKAGAGGVGGSSYGAPGPAGAAGVHADKNF